MDANTPTTPLPPAQEPQPAQPVQQANTLPQQPEHEPFYKRYGLAFAIATLVLGAFVILAFVGVGAFAVGNLVSHAGAGISHVFVQRGEPGIPGQGNGPKPGQGQGQGNGQGQGSKPGNEQAAVRGTIASISGSTWTITTQRGASVTVDVTSSTRFGLPNGSKSASDFAVGQEVIVVGSRSGDTIEASRILDLSNFKMPFSTPGGPSAPTTPTP